MAIRLLAAGLFTAGALSAGCVSAPNAILDRAEGVSEIAADTSLDYLCNRIRVRQLRELIGVSAARLRGWALLCDQLPTAPVLVNPGMSGGEKTVAPPTQLQ